MTKEDFRKALANGLAKRMNELDIDLTTLSERTDIHLTMLYRYIRAESIPSSYYLAKLAKVLHCTMTDLIGY